METQTQADGKIDDTKSPTSVKIGDTLFGFAALLGCIVTGIIGIGKAMDAEGVGAASCLLAAVAAFGAAYYICSRKD